MAEPFLKDPAESLPLIDTTCSHGSCKDAGSYVLPGSCSNCGEHYRVKITKGHEAPATFSGARCPNCGCSRVVCHPPHAGLHSK